MPHAKPVKLSDDQPITWKTWYPLLRDDPEKYGLVKVPIQIRKLPCGCRESFAKTCLQIFRGKGDKFFKCNRKGCGKNLR